MSPRLEIDGDTMSRRKEMRRLIRAYKDETGECELDMRKVAQWATKKGWPLPTPPDPLDFLTKQFTEAARERGRVRRKDREALPRLSRVKGFAWRDATPPFRGYRRS